MEWLVTVTDKTGDPCCSPHPVEERVIAADGFVGQDPSLWGRRRGLLSRKFGSEPIGRLTAKGLIH